MHVERIERQVVDASQRAAEAPRRRIRTARMLLFRRTQGRRARKRFRRRHRFRRKHWFATRTQHVRFFFFIFFLLLCPLAIYANDYANDYANSAAGFQWMNTAICKFRHWISELFTRGVESLIGFISISLSTSIRKGADALDAMCQSHADFFFFLGKSDEVDCEVRIWSVHI